MSSPLLQTRIKNLHWTLIAFLASSLLGLSALISFKFPFMPVPWIVQNQLVLMIGYLFGPRIGFFSALFFLVEGLLGAPVFSLGRSGPAMLLGTSGGYLLAYPVASLLSGWLRYKVPASFFFIFFNLFLSNLVIYLLGFIQLSHFIGAMQAMKLGVIPFMAIDTVKTILATFFLKKLRFKV